MGGRMTVTGAACACAVLWSLGAGAGEPLQPVWKARCEFQQGLGMALAVGGDEVACSGGLGVLRFDVRSGRRLKKLPETECLGPVSGLQYAGRHLLWRCEFPRGEEERQPVPTVAELAVVERGQRKLAWSRTGLIPVDPLPVGERLLFVQDGVLQAVRLSDGRPQWRAEAPGVAALASLGGLAIVARPGADQAWELLAFELDTGATRWRRGIGAGREIRLAAGQHQLIALVSGEESTASRILGLRVETGEVAWTQRLAGEMLWFDPSVAGGRIFVASERLDDRPAALRALDETDGRILWSRELSTDSNGHDFRPAIFGERLLIWTGDLEQLKRHAVSLEYQLLCLRADTGADVWLHRPRALEKPILSGALPVGGKILYTDGFWLRAFRAPAATRGPKPAVPPRRGD